MLTQLLYATYIYSILGAYIVSPQWFGYWMWYWFIFVFYTVMFSWGKFMCDNNNSCNNEFYTTRNNFFNVMHELKTTVPVIE